jgi:AcrR family transcriptional regulator
MSALLYLAIRLGNVYNDNMTSDDNSVNIKKAKRAYHHGDLRAALVQAGLEQLKSRAVEDVSLREIARSVGVSATAVYRHFPDKAALLLALCLAGTEELGRFQQQAMQAAGGGKTGFDEVGRAYVRFALSNPTLFRLIMSTVPAEDLTKQALEQTTSGMRLLRESIADLAPAGASEEDKRIFAIQSWAHVHGLAMLMLDGLLPASEALIDKVIDSSPIIAKRVQ